jgi:uncharacterized membrane protein YdjX (TVP38/TMEM64 family)
MGEPDERPPTGEGGEAAPVRFSPRRLWPLALLAAGLGLFFAFRLDRWLSFETLAAHREAAVAWAAANRALAAAVFILLYVTATAFSVPGAVWLTIGGGFVFGTLAGTLYAVAGATAGAVLVFLAARYAVGDWLAAKAGPALRRMEDGFRRDAFNYLLILRLIPLFPFWLVNLVPAFLGVRLSTFALATFVGIIPGGAVYAGIGSGLSGLLAEGQTPDLGVVFRPEVFLPLLGLAVLAFLPVLYRRFGGRRKGGKDG